MYPTALDAIKPSIWPRVMTAIGQRAFVRRVAHADVFIRLKREKPCSSRQG
jgi:hypothetical protein